MYVCLCKGVNDRAIRDAVEEGARSWREVRERTGCATQCGKCAGTGKGVMREAIAEEMAMAAQDLAYAV
ncbi:MULTISPECIES: (2Fe-2S)-binding protein [Halomonadaceae]|uniref:(2Fe-2S)-binding protein n=1 Tax=Halomonas TaxID=2745 RepID=UPI0018A7D189|nr:(2Fe-2S)-binding protein [Halomonas sp. 328]MBF8222705.1 (2Fe-2S)-binding protein [Halomonas sp. 328]